MALVVIAITLLVCSSSPGHPRAGRVRRAGRGIGDGRGRILAHAPPARADGAGRATIVFLVGPMLVVIPMSFTGAKILSWPPEGFSFQWYAKMIQDPQWSRGFSTSCRWRPDGDPLDGPGHPGRLGVVRGDSPGKGLANALILSPLIVPVIIIAIGFLRVLFDHPADTGRCRGSCSPTRPGGAIRHHRRRGGARTMDRNLEMAAASLGAESESGRSGASRSRSSCPGSSPGRSSRSSCPGMRWSVSDLHDQRRSGRYRSRCGNRSARWSTHGGGRRQVVMVVTTTLLLFGASPAVRRRSADGGTVAASRRRERRRTPRLAEPTPAPAPRTPRAGDARAPQALGDFTAG